MHRREFLKGALPVAACAGGLVGHASRLVSSTSTAKSSASDNAKHPRAITMWEFSWIERPGAGFEDWDQALDELKQRGYDAVRIDPFPHLLATDPRRTWTLLPEWNTQDWGSPDVNRIVLMPALTDFIAKCGRCGIKVGLSTWYRQDQDNTRMAVTGPEIMAAQWIKTLDTIREAGLLDTILYVDLCNEWPGQDWAPFVTPRMTYGDWQKPQSLAWMHKAIALVREKYPNLPLQFSFAGDPAPATKQDLSGFDLLDTHVWMTQQNNGEFYKLTGYNYERFDPKGYTNLSLKSRARISRPPGVLERIADQRNRSAGRLVKGDSVPSRNNRVLGHCGLQGLAAAELGLGEGPLRSRRTASGSQRAVARRGHQQFLRAAVRGHVARCRLAPRIDPGHQNCGHKPRSPKRPAIRSSLVTNLPCPIFAPSFWREGGKPRSRPAQDSEMPVFD